MSSLHDNIKGDDTMCKVIGCDGQGNLYNSRGYYYGKCSCATNSTERKQVTPNTALGELK